MKTGESSNGVRNEKKSSEDIPSERFNKGKRTAVFDDVYDYYESNSTTLNMSLNGVVEDDKKKSEKPAYTKIKIMFKGKTIRTIIKEEREEVGFHRHAEERSNKSVVSSLSKNDEYSNRCPLCNKGFSSMKAVHGHMRSHSDRTEPKPMTKPKPKPNTKPITRQMEEVAAGCSASSAGGYICGKTWLPCSWPSAAKRRRTAGGGGVGVGPSGNTVSCVENEELLKCSLMLLPTGDENKKAMEDVNSNNAARKNDEPLFDLNEMPSDML